MTVMLLQNARLGLGKSITGFSPKQDEREGRLLQTEQALGKDHTNSVETHGLWPQADEVQVFVLSSPDESWVSFT